MKKDKKETKTTKTAKTAKRVNSCYFTQSGTEPDYKEVLTLKRFTSDRGKIVPNKYTGISSRYQRKLATEIKKARYMALLPFTDQHAL